MKKLEGEDVIKREGTDAEAVYRWKLGRLRVIFVRRNGSHVITRIERRGTMNYKRK